MIETQELDIQGLQKQVDILANHLDKALHKLADYQRVVAGAVSNGVYCENEKWWRELWRLAEEQAVEQNVQRTTPTVAPVCTCSMDDGIHEWNCALEVARRSL